MGDLSTQGLQNLNQVGGSLFSWTQVSFANKKKEPFDLLGPHIREEGAE